MFKFGVLNIEFVAVVFFGTSVGAFAKEKTHSAGFINSKGEPSGTVSLSDSDKGLKIKIEATGLSPGQHGFHIHSKGECLGDFKSAGPHHTTPGHQHGLMNAKGPHEGDMPNIEASKDGKVSTTVENKKISLASLQDADGSALIVHAGPDDQKTDPSGNSGDRVLCAVLYAAKK